MFFDGIPNILKNKEELRVMKNFSVELLPFDLTKSLEKCDYRSPTLVQAIAIPLLLDERKFSCIIQAKNGQGKTLAFAVPCLLRVQPEVKKIQVLVLVHNTEMAGQHATFFNKLCKQFEKT